MKELNPDNERQCRMVMAEPDFCCGEVPTEDASEWVPPVDILSGRKELLFKVDLPEMTGTDVKVLLERNVLYITGTREPENQRNGTRCLRIERPHGYFVRRFALPDNVCRGEIKARLAGGVLEVRVPKTPPHQVGPAYPQRIDVAVTCSDFTGVACNDRRQAQPGT